MILIYLLVILGLVIIGLIAIHMFLKKHERRREYLGFILAIIATFVGFTLANMGSKYTEKKSSVQRVKTIIKATINASSTRISEIDSIYSILYKLPENSFLALHEDGQKILYDINKLTNPNMLLNSLVSEGELYNFLSPNFQTYIYPYIKLLSSHDRLNNIETPIKNVKEILSYHRIEIEYFILILQTELQYIEGDISIAEYDTIYKYEKANDVAKMLFLYYRKSGGEI